jgi:hypothetical protein
MSTPKLIWSMAVRGGGWTTGIGALLGAAYGVVLLMAAMLPQVQFNAGNAGLPLLVAFVYVFLIAALFGATVAGAIGFIAGPIGGLLCALMTRLFFLPLRDARVYRVVAAFAGGLYGILALVVAVRLISTSGLAPQIVTFRETVMLYVFPALIAGAAGVYISQKVVGWYQETARVENASAPQKPFGAAGPA